MTGRAKWDAWNVAGKAYQDNYAQAEKKYLEIAKVLGWNEGFTAGSLFKPEQKDDLLDDIWDDSEGDSGSSGGGSGGMGVSVSRVVADEPSLDEEEGGSLHGLTLANNVPAMLSYLMNHLDADINGLDQHVCNLCSLLMNVAANLLNPEGIHSFAFSLRQRQCPSSGVVIEQRGRYHSKGEQARNRQERMMFMPP